MSLLAMESGQVRFVRSAALLLENEVNPVRERAERVAQWLNEQPVWRPTDAAAMQARVGELMGLGFKNFDALHLACAEAAGATLFVSTDDRLLSAAARHAGLLRTQVCGVLESLKELPK
jgi:hypothetical protein